MTAGIGIPSNLLDDAPELVDVPAIGRRPGTPLTTVDRAQIAFRIGPLVPDSDSVFLQIPHVGITPEEPQELIHHGFEVDPFGGDQRESLGQVESHLVSEDAQRPGPGAVALRASVIANMSQEIEVLFHGVGLRSARASRNRWYVASRSMERKAWAISSGRAAARAPILR